MTGGDGLFGGDNRAHRDCFEYVTASNDVILFRFRGRNRRVKIKI